MQKVDFSGSEAITLFPLIQLVSVKTNTSGGKKIKGFRGSEKEENVHTESNANEYLI